MCKTNEKLLDNVKRLVTSMMTSLSPEEIAKIDVSAFDAVRQVVTPEIRDPDVRLRKIGSDWIREDSPFTMEQLEERADKVCGCNGRYDCDCVSVFNQASRELWTEHNGRCRLATEGLKA